MFHILDHSSAYLLNHIPTAIPTVVTVHDLLPLYPESPLSPVQRTRFAACVADLTKATRLIAVSEFTKREIQRFLPIPGDKIVVIPNGVAQPSTDSRKDAQRPRIRDGRVHILSVGSVLPRKNLEIFPEVCRCLHEMAVPSTIHRVGQRLDPALSRQISHHSELIEHGLASDETLTGLYQTCDLLLFPSWLEGFGLPVLEAMTHGCPVVCSNATSLPEAGGDAALYFDPAEPADAAAQIARLIREPDLVARLREDGRRRAAEFTWDRHLEGCLRTYEAAGYRG